MLSLYREGWERGERRRAVVCLARAASAGTGCLPLSETAAWILECERQYPFAEEAEEVDFELFYGYVNLGMFDKAQRQLELLEPWGKRDWFVGCSWALLAAKWGIATSDRVDWRKASGSVCRPPSDSVSAEPRRRQDPARPMRAIGRRSAIGPSSNRRASGEGSQKALNALR